jgi:hypothetical protein
MRSGAIAHALPSGLALCVRLLVLLLGLQVSGIAALAELSLREHGCTACCEDCPLDREGRECPPSCPDCHCAHGGSTALPRSFAVTLSELHDAGQPIKAHRAERAGPRSSATRGVYRPPRTPAV